jgi:hypothetical protein
MTAKLIDIDRTESAVLRRRLRPWMPGDAERLRPLVREVIKRQRDMDSNIPDAWADGDFRWEAHVYPLFYYGWKGEPEKQADVHKRIAEKCCQVFDVPVSDHEKLLPLIQSVANAEIDLVIESERYFMFIEAKTPREGKRAHFQGAGKLHQLVRQLAEGAMLSKLIGKQFILATLGCADDVVLSPSGCSEGSRCFKPSEKERQLLQLMRFSFLRGPKVLRVLVST